MAEVLVQFDPPLTDRESGETFVARICGREREDGMWEGWIEFDPQGGGTTLRTPRETEQPKRTDLEYWSTGLTVSYLEGALVRARNPKTPDLRPRMVAAEPTYDGPAGSAPGASSAGGSPQVRPNAVLDPFQVYSQGEDVLRSELSALDEGHLVNIIRAYSLGGRPDVDPLPADRSVLAERIVAGVRERRG